MRKLFLLLVFLLLGSPAYGAVAYVATATSGDTGFTDTVSATINVGAGTNRLLVCGVHSYNTTGIVTTVTSDDSVNNLSLTQSAVGRIGNPAKIDVWYRINPTAGSQTVTAILSDVGNLALTCIAFSGADQITPFGTGGYYYDIADASVTITVPTEGAGVAFGTNGDEAAVGTFTVDAASTKRADYVDFIGNANLVALASTKTTAETAAMTISHSTCCDYFVVIALPINAAAATTPPKHKPLVMQ